MVHRKFIASGMRCRDVQYRLSLKIPLNTSGIKLDSNYSIILGYSYLKSLNNSNTVCICIIKDNG